MNELYLITGAAGHLGSAIVKKLRKDGKNIRALILPNEKSIPNCDEFFYGDVLDKKSLNSFFENKENKELIVIHAAGIVSIASKHNQIVYDVNVTGTKNIVDMCKKHGVKKLVYVSSVHAIPEKPAGQVMMETENFSPEKVKGLYAQTKAEATAFVLREAQAGLNANVVHPSGICGPYDNGKGHMTALVVEYCKGHLTSIVKGGYDFVDVRDVADGIIACCEKAKGGECYILSNRYYSVREMIRLLHEITGKREIKHTLPDWFINLTAPLAETYYKTLRQPPLFTASSLDTLRSNSLFSHEKADKELGYCATNMKTTLFDTVKWLIETNRIKGILTKSS